MTALLTCNIGGIDEVKEPVEQSLVHDYFSYTEKNLPYPLPNLGDRLKGKYLKINPHRFLSNYDNFVWIDGRIEVNSTDFLKFITAPLDEYDIVIPLHPHRTNVYEEITFVQELMAAGNPYLLKRYAHEPFMDEWNFYKREGLPRTFPLYACGCFARRNDEKLNRIFRDWWLRSIEFTSFDQCMFSYIAWKFDLKVYTFPYEELLKFITVGKHKIVK
jgi:hypothetical protein